MFSLFKKKPTTDEWEEIIQKSFDSPDLNKTIKTLKSAYNANKNDEEMAGWIVGNIYEKNLHQLFDTLPEFVTNFPDSLHAVRIYLADLFARQDNFDLATEHSRKYLRIANDNNALEKLNDFPIIRHAVSRAFLLLTSAYTECGARSYSKRILSNSLKYDLEDEWKDATRKELIRIDKELQEVQNSEVDSKWENFFANGSNSGDLFNLCSSKGFNQLASRIDLIESNFRFNQSFKISSDEYFKIVTMVNDNNCLI